MCEFVNSVGQGNVTSCQERVRKFHQPLVVATCMLSDITSD